MIQFGKYDQKVSFIQYGTTSDGYGGTVPLPASILDTFSNVTQIQGSNNLESAQLELPKTYKFKVQHRAGFEPNETMQIIYKGIAHVIKGIEINVERNFREWIITATKTNNAVSVAEAQNNLDSSLDFTL